VFCGLIYLLTLKKKLHISVRDFIYGFGHVLNTSSHYSAKQHSRTQICNADAA